MAFDFSRHEWKPVVNLEVGDFIHRWGDWLEVTGVKAVAGRVEVSYKDGDEVKTAAYKITDELMVPFEYDELEEIAAEAEMEMEAFMDEVDHGWERNWIGW